MTSTSVSGVSEDYLGIKDWTLVYGRNIQYADITARHKVCVIGAYVADELYGSAEKAYGETIKVNGYAFQIVGVVEQQDDDLEEGGTDDFLFMPYSCAIKMARNASINNYTFTIRDLSAATEGKTLIENFLYEKFKNEDLYTVTAMSEMLDSLNSMIAMVSQAWRHCWNFPAGGRRGRYEHYAGVRHGADKRNRNPKGIRSKAERHHAAVCDRSSGDQFSGRRDRNSAGKHWPPPPLER